MNSSQEVSEEIGEESQIEASKEKNKSGVEGGGAAAAAAKLGEEKEARAEDSREAAATTLRDNQSGAVEEEERNGKTQGALMNLNRLRDPVPYLFSAQDYCSLIQYPQYSPSKVCTAMYFPGCPAG